MGEYANRIKDGVRIKIGTCNSMYYCRLEQRKEISYPYPTDKLYWRIPLPEEDGIEPGDFSFSPYRNSRSIPLRLMLDTSKFKEEDIVVLKSQGTVQVKEPITGLLVNLRCPHGLPMNSSVVHKESGLVSSYCYNGRNETLYLSSLRNDEKELKLIIKCVACGETWSLSFDEAEPLIIDLWMKLRLFRQVVEYHYQNNDDECNLNVTVNSKRDTFISIYTAGKGEFVVKKNEEEIAKGSWSVALEKFVSLLPHREDFNENNPIEMMSIFYRLARQTDEVRNNLDRI